MGVKPLFYTMCKGQFIFASEIKTILCHPDVIPQIDLNSVSELILIGPGRTPGYGVFYGIKEILPGECATFGRDGLNVKRYWNLKDKVHTDSPDETAQKVRFLVKDAIERQLVSDVPLGTFLSGGLDSSIISSVAAKYFKERGKQLTTFSVYYKDNDKYFSKSKFQPDSDTKYIDIMCDYLGSDHKSIVIDTPALVEALYNAVDARDLPGMADVDSSLLLFCKEVKKHCTVALSGECADEIFGGYPWYRDKSITRKKGFPWAQTTDWRNSFLLPDISKNISAEEYVMNKYQKTADQSDIIDTGNEDDKHHKIMMNLNINWFMQTLLDRKDRMSMYSGLEVRVPFCDWRICDYLYSVPFEMKEYAGFEKGLLRKAVTGLLPDEILWRKKSPYPKTHNPEYLNMVSNILKEIISDPNQPIFNIIDRNQLAKLPDNSSSTPWYGQLMTIPQTIAYFIQLNYWMNKFKPEIIL